MKAEAYKLFLSVKEGTQTPEEAQVALVNLLDSAVRRKPETYTGEDMLNCKLGLYEVFWRDGDSPSIAAIGMTRSGKKWIFPVNWICEDDGLGLAGRLDTLMEGIDRIVLIRSG